MAYSGLTSCDTKKQFVGAQTCAKVPESAVPSRNVRLMVPELPRMRRFALFLTRDHDWADDLVQESLARAIKHFDTWEPGTNLRVWLLMIVKNTFLTEMRRRNHRPAITGNPLAIEQARANGSSPEVIAELREVLRAFNRLSPRFREVLLLVAVEGLTYEKAAGIIGAPVGTVRSRISRARATMRKELSSTASQSHVSSRGPHGHLIDH
jgi:RNA polymerase sigma-70 factor, ECF subfamily